MKIKKKNIDLYQIHCHLTTEIDIPTLKKYRDFSFGNYELVRQIDQIIEEKLESEKDKENNKRKNYSEVQIYSE